MRSYLPMLYGKEAVGLLVLTMAFFGCRYLTSTPEPIAFKNVVEFKDFAASKGIYFHAGNTNGVVGCNFYVADHPLTLDDLAPVTTRRDCGLIPGWRGILWVSQMKDWSDRLTLHSESIDGNWRIWGDILVAGDEEFMDRIEDFYRNK